MQLRKVTHCMLLLFFNVIVFDQLVVKSPEIIFITPWTLVSLIEACSRAWLLPLDPTTVSGDNSTVVVSAATANLWISLNVIFLKVV